MASELEIVFTDTALKQFRAIVKGSKNTAKRILKKIEAYATDPDNNYDIKTLKGQSGNRLRLRIGSYRIIFKRESERIIITLIKHRKEAYND
ncbi:MAG: type II toxin-antitoxin system RelE/ParE family toxin [Nitrospirae bacterium]|nr:type II toxin-antitoxin system RelE/ParE family toxin [Nitrospirota bacterium]